MAAPSRLETLDTLRTANLDVAFATAFGTLVGGSFLVGFIQHLGGSDVAIGLASGIPALAGLMQIPGAAFGRSQHSFKKFVQVGGGLWRLFYLPFVILALVTFPKDIRLSLLLLCIACASVATQFVGPIYNEWIGNLVPERSRGWYFSQRTIIASITGMVVGMAGAVLLDQFKGTPREAQGFALVFGIGAITAALSWYFFQKMSDLRREVVEKTSLKSIVEVVKGPFQDKNFRKIMVFTGVFWIGGGFVGNLFSAYALETLHMHFTVLQMTSVSSTLGTILTVKIWGFLADRYGNKPILALNVLGVTFTPIMWLSTAPGNDFRNAAILIGGHTFAGIFWSGIGITAMNLYLSVSPIDKRANYLASVTTVQAIVTFIAPTIGASVMAALRVPMGPEAAYKTLFLISMCGRFIGLLALIPVKEYGSYSLGETVRNLSKVSPRGVAALRAMRKGTDDKARESAIRAVGQSQLTIATDELAIALADPSPRVRREAAEALSRMGTPEAGRALAKFISDHPDLVEEETLVALGFTSGKDNAEILTGFLEDPSPILRRAAAKALGRINDPVAIAALDRAVRQPGDPDLRRAAIQALRIMGSADPDHFREALFDQHPSIRTAAAEAVAELEITDLAESLRKSLENLRDEGSSEAAYALGVVGQPSDVAVIVSAAEATANPAKRKRCLLGIARLMECERDVYRFFTMDEVVRDNALLQRVRPLLKKHPVLKKAIDAYADGHEKQAMLILCEESGVSELLPLAESGLESGFLVTLLAYLRKMNVPVS